MSTPTVQQTQLSQLQLPPPHTFDILPALHEILARVDCHFSPKSTEAAALDEGIDSDGNTGERHTDLQPLDPQQLPAEVLSIKQKIRKAIRELEKLPDMERSVEEQQEEIEELEGKIMRQRAMIAMLGEMAQEVQDRASRNGSNG